jgi:hypothetical protein
MGVIIMTKIKNFQLESAFMRDPRTGAVVGPIASLIGTKMNVHAASKVRRIARMLEGPLKDYTEQRDALISEYGENNGINESSPRWSEFVSAYNELLLVEVPVDCEALTPDELWCREDGKREPIDIEPSALGLLEDMGLLK